MYSTPLNGSEVRKNGRLRTPIVSIIATNQRSDPFVIKFLVGNFAHGDTILRTRLTLELESPPEIPRQTLGRVIQLAWPIDATTLATKDGPDLAVLLATSGYSLGDLFRHHTQKSALWLTVKPEVFAPFTSLPVWPDVTLEDPGLDQFGEFVPKCPFLFKLDSHQLVWRHIVRAKLGLPISC